jgi:hypothetical protein
VRLLVVRLLGLVVTTCAEEVVVVVGKEDVVGTEDREREAEIEAGNEEGASDMVAVPVSEKREPLRLYAAAQAAKSIP